MFAWSMRTFHMGRGTLFNVKPTVGFTLPRAGVTPAPNERKMRDFVPVRTFLEIALRACYRPRRRTLTSGADSGSTIVVL
jgi:hypothetical protein